MTEHITPWNLCAHGINRILVHQQTPFQDLCIVETGSYGKALILDGKLQLSTEDEFLYHEPLVHPAFILHTHPRRVLLLGGGDGAALREILRWRTVEEVVLVDLDAAVVAACTQYLPELHQQAFEDPRVKVVFQDALEFVDQTSANWDVIISDLSDPFETGPSLALFTQEFFRKLQRVLAPGGVCAFQAGSVSVIESSIHVRIVHTLSTVFSSVLSYSSYPSSYGVPIGFALAADRPLSDQVDPKQVDQLLSKQTSMLLRMLDGQTLLGLLQTPKHLRQAISAETQIYTLVDPPKFMNLKA
jgi:spermidine synthase